MPSTIPYDPSLVLGNLVSLTALENLDQISALQAPIDAAEDDLNSKITLKRSIDMTIQELVDMNIDASDLMKQSADIGVSVREAAIEFAKVKVDNLSKIQPLKGKIRGLHEGVESPIDYNKTAWKQVPFSADSMTMNVQYFSFDENQQDATTQASAVRGFISAEVSEFGTKAQAQVSTSVQKQMNSQYSRHSISGTLVISITCTHKNALVLAPFYIDVDKAIRVWNKVYPGEKINIVDKQNLIDIISKGDGGNEKTLTLLSGCTYGSCFIGMVHILNTTSTSSSESALSIADSMQVQMTISNWLESAKGGFGSDSSFSNDVKNLLSSQSISSHCSLVTMGAIPSISASDLKMAVSQFATFDGSESMSKLATLQAVTADDKTTINSAAKNARTGQTMAAMEGQKIQNVLTGLKELDDKTNKVLDINSMMNALDDYIKKALLGNSGVPINFYLKSISRFQLAEMWMAKYYPGQQMTVGGDDSTAAGTNSAPAAGNTSQ